MQTYFNTISLTCGNSRGKSDTYGPASRVAFRGTEPLHSLKLSATIKFTKNDALPQILETKYLLAKSDALLPNLGKIIYCHHKIHQKWCSATKSQWYYLLPYDSLTLMLCYEFLVKLSVAIKFTKSDALLQILGKIICCHKIHQKWCSATNSW